MKGSSPNCSHDIGLLSYRRGWFNKRRCCLKKCRDDSNLRGRDPASENALSQIGGLIAVTAQNDNLTKN